MQNFITVILYTAITICSIFMLIQLAYLFIIVTIRKGETNPIPDSELPTISILVAARNEALNIVECMTALDELEYPEGKIEIILGNDLSTDYTQMLIEQFIKNKPKFRLINMTGNEHPSTKGKAKVLATLANAAKGDYYLITDADITVNKDWAKAMVCTMIKNNADMTGGTTNITAHNRLEQYQQVDWLYFMGIIHSFASIGKNLTVVGNNMGISAKAYKAVGGYESIPFSITEDYALFKAIKEKGFKTYQKFNVQTMVYSQALNSVKAILKQRKRWLKGGWDLPFYYHVIMFIFGAWYFALPILFILNWKLALVIFIVKDFIQLFQFLKINNHLKLKVEHPFALMTYELYLFYIIPLTAINFLSNSPNVWKGRKY
jgi:cellulose synthase/poly-beta-1,6-N-acetylglucosamine synthase-like glycosyltransferase